MTHFEQHHSFDLQVQVRTLQAAVRRGAFTHVEYLLKEKGLRDIVGLMKPGTNTLLFHCVMHTKSLEDEKIGQRVQVMKMLVDINSRLLEETLNGIKPLVSLHAHTRLRIELIQLGANLSPLDNFDQTILHILVGNHEEYHSLLTQVPENCLRQLITTRDLFGETALHNVVKKFDPSTEILTIFQNIGADFNSFNYYGDSILSSAVRHGRKVDTLMKLIKLYGCDVDRMNGDTFLHCYLTSSKPSNTGFQEIVECLVEMDKSSLLETKGGETGSTPLQLAMLKMELGKETLLLLHSNGVNLHTPDKLGRTVLFYAISGKRSTDIISLSIELGADWKVLDNKNRNMLHLSAQEGTVEHLKYFLQLGELDVNGMDSGGNTPLHCAALYKNKSIIEAEAKRKLLTDKGSDPSITNKDGDTAAVTAMKKIQFPPPFRHA